MSQADGYVCVLKRRREAAAAELAGIEPGTDRHARRAAELAWLAAEIRRIERRK